jgi:malonate-semialdehyde dehydrogenase (acetylating)/methylmalonate-semialdehyde dehydrogenase
MKALLDKHLDELTLMVATRTAGVGQAMGDVLKVTEVVEFACGIPHLMMGPALMNCTGLRHHGMEPLGVRRHRAVELSAMIPWGGWRPSAWR